MPSVIHVCRFDSCSDLRGKQRTYANIKALVLKARRYSVFEATATMKDAILFETIERDLELETWPIAYPWRGVRRREVQPMTDQPSRIAQMEQRITAAKICNGLYEITSDGLVWAVGWNWRGVPRRPLTAHLDEHGYLKVRLTLARGRRVKKAVHALVCEAFHGPRPDGFQVRHLNGIRTDNRAVNLTWGSAKDNAADRECHGHTAKGDRNGFAKLTRDQVREIHSLKGLEPQHVTAARMGVNQTTISRIVRGVQWTT